MAAERDEHVRPHAPSAVPEPGRIAFALRKYHHDGFCRQAAWKRDTTTPVSKEVVLLCRYSYS